MDHIVLNVKDDEKMIAFYSEVLCLGPERLVEYRAGQVPFPFVRLNANTVIDLFPKRMWQRGEATGRSGQNLNHFCMALGKGAWQELLERLENSGVTIEDGPIKRWGARGTGISVYFRDPDGNMIEARYYEEADVSAKCLLGS